MRGKVERCSNQVTNVKMNFGQQASHIQVGADFLPRYCVEYRVPCCPFIGEKKHRPARAFCELAVGCCGRFVLGRLACWSGGADDS